MTAPIDPRETEAQVQHTIAVSARVREAAIRELGELEREARAQTEREIKARERLGRMRRKGLWGWVWRLRS